MLSVLSFRVFTPCLMFSKLGVGIGVEETLRLWPLSANMVLRWGLFRGAARGRALVVAVAHQREGAWGRPVAAANKLPSRPQTEAEAEAAGRGAGHVTAPATPATAV